MPGGSTTGGSTSGTSASGTSTPATLNGNYVFTESGPTANTLALLTFSASGTVTGTEIVQETNPAVLYAVQGTYTINPDNTGTLSLTGTSMVTDANGVPLTWDEKLTFLTSANGNLATLRVGSNVNATGEIVPAAMAAAQGSYVLAGSAADPALVRAGVFNLDGFGNLTGTEIANSFGIMNTLSVKGTYAGQAGALQTLNLTTTGTDSYGNMTTNSEKYAFLATQKDVRMIRLDSGAQGIVTLSQ